LAAGAKRVVLIEPKLDPSLGRLAGDLDAFNAFPGRPRDLVPTEVVGRIIAYRDLDQAPSALDGKVDVACSHLVLEHFENLESFFAHTRRLLAPGGVSHNRVDLSDHTYHVLGKYPFLQRFAASRILHHLRYSDAVFRFVNDPKCYMNRVLLPEYLRLAVAHGFRVENLERVFHDRAVVHPDLHRRYAGSDPRDLQVVNFSLDLVKPA
ncbi:MAG TPA: methyltransferase domain-containing protein, partial [Fibrobacteria bacterium]|nr:methyltransferase domain-containing protein [Fibrobacteria bacterium]